MESKELAIRLARALDAKKGYNIRILHVENLTTVTDYFVIATGNSTTHVGAGRRGGLPVGPRRRERAAHRRP